MKDVLYDIYNIVDYLLDRGIINKNNIYIDSIKRLELSHESPAKLNNGLSYSQLYFGIDEKTGYVISIDYNDYKQWLRTNKIKRLCVK